ncbi:MAG: hypothetical protein IKG01_09715 [Lachnospiraceae bacterium]|nr:hypothetical protein [Lachnospiraceae bacterium]
MAKPELDNGRIYIQVKKAGKATITIKNNTTKKTYKTVLKVVKYRNPFKKFYLSGKNRAGKFKTYNYAAFTNNKTSSKVSIKTKAGWKIRKITYCKSVYNEKTEKLANHTKKIKNNSTIKLKKSGSSNNVFQFVECEVYNKKNKLTQTFGLDF